MEVARITNSMDRKIINTSLKDLCLRYRPDHNSSAVADVRTGFRYTPRLGGISCLDHKQTCELPEFQAGSDRRRICLQFKTGDRYSLRAELDRPLAILVHPMLCIRQIGGWVVRLIL